MKYLISYKLFLEEVEEEAEEAEEEAGEQTDDPDVKEAKEALTNLKKDLSDYKAKKTLIDNAYLNVSSDADLQSKVDEIIGKDNKNIFITDYLHVASLNRKVNNIQKDVANDKIRKDDFTQELKMAQDGGTKQAISAKITDINNRISTKNADLASLLKEINDAQTKLNKKMIDTEKTMMDNIKKISSKSPK